MPAVAPMRNTVAVRLLSNLRRGKQESRLDKSLQDLAHRFGKSGRQQPSVTPVVS